MLCSLAGLFALGHSGLASHTVKGWANRRWGEGRVARLYRLTYNGVAVLSAVGLLGLVYWFPGGAPVWVIPPAWWPATVGLQIVAIGGLGYSLWQIDLGYFIGLRQVFHATSVGDKLPAELCDTGLYGWVRHPVYVFLLTAFWLFPVMTPSYLAVCVTLTCYAGVGSFLEERKLVQEWGERYRLYQRRVWWLW